MKFFQGDRCNATLGGSRSIQLSYRGQYLIYALRVSDHLTLRRYVCRIACDVLTYTAVHFDHATAIIHILCCAIQSTLRAYYNQSNR